MSTSDDLNLVDEATARLEATVRSTSLAEINGASLLPGWSRGHVLSHLARNADGLRNLMLSPRSGTPVSIYGSVELRDANIEAGALRPASAVAVDVLESSRLFLVDAQQLTNEHWSSQVQVSRGGEEGPRINTDAILWMRASEVEIHHVDLGLEYTFRNTPVPLADRLIDEAIRRYGPRISKGIICVDTLRNRQWSCGPESDQTVISGPQYALLGWLTGRSSGEDLTVGTHSALPDLPAYG